MKNSYLYTCLLCLTACTVVSVQAQNATLPTTEAQTKAIIANRGQITDVPTVYIWMLDAELNKKQTKPNEYTDDYLETLDKNDYYYMVKTKGSSTYDLKVSNNIIKNNPSVTDNATILPNYARYEAKSEQYRLARIKVVDGFGDMKVRDELTTIRGRGNSTWYCDKKAYRLKFPTKTKLLAQADGTNNYDDAKNWTLLANAGDKTMLRNALTREVSLLVEQKTGIKAMPFHPAYKFVDIVLNDVYMGTYQVSDHVQVNPGRINIDEQNGWFLEAVYGSNFLEENYVEVGKANGFSTYNVNIKNPEDEFYTEEVKANILAYLDEAYSCVQEYGTNDFSKETGLFKYVDMESLAAYFIINEITGNYDGLIQNYMYRDTNEGDKLKFGPMWDYDIAYGNYNNSNNELTNGFIFKNGKDSGLKGIVARLFENCPEFASLVNERWRQVYDNGSLATNLLGKIDEIAKILTHTAALNYTPVSQGGAGWDLTSDMLGWGVKTFSTYEQSISDIKSFVSAHIDWLNTNIPQLMPKAVECTFDVTSWSVDVASYKNKQCNVTLNNCTLKAGVWNTVCLPFALSADQLTALFGNEVQVLEYSSFENGVMNFCPVSAITAGVPCLVKYSGSDLTNPVFTNVTVQSSAPGSVTFGDYTFTGTYSQINNNHYGYDGSGLILNGSTGRFEPVKTYTSLLGMNAYVKGPANGSAMEIVIASGENFSMGDVNHDGKVTVADVMATVNAALGHVPALFFPAEADLNGDGNITVSDVMAIVRKGME